MADEAREAKKVGTTNAQGRGGADTLTYGWVGRVARPRSSRVQPEVAEEVSEAKNVGTTNE